MKRLLGKVDEAFAEELELEKDNLAKLGKPDGFVFEELAELYLLRADGAKARDYFNKAYPLVKDQLTDPKERKRLARIKRLGSS